MQQAQTHEEVGGRPWVEPITAARPRQRCMAIIGSASSMFPDVWIGEGRPGRLPSKKQHQRAMAWTGNPGTVYCGERATLDIGYPVCEQHGAVGVASDILRQLHRLTGCDWRSYHWSVTIRAHVLACHPELFDGGEAS